MAEVSSPAAVTVKALSKAYGRTQAIEAVGFDVAPGEVFGLLGPNGAGKTTTLECLTGLIAPDSGEVTIGGVDVLRRGAQAKARLGAVLQTTGLQDAIRPAEALDAFAVLQGRPCRTAELLAAFGLEEKKDAPVASLSGGQKQRLALALALVNDPLVVVLDEPSSGLDLQARRDLHDMIRDLRADGRAVLLASHDMDEVGQLCDRIAVLSGGRIVAHGRPADLIAAAGPVVRVRGTASAILAPELIARLGGAVADLTVEGETFSFSTNDLVAALARLTAELSAEGLALQSLRAERGDLEEVILRLTRGEIVG